MRILCLFALLLGPAFAQYKVYSDWTPTNEPGVQYRWIVDDVHPRACTIQFRDEDKDGVSFVHASVSYRNLHQPASVLFRLSVTNPGGETNQKLLLSCTFLDHVEVTHIVRK